jgi:tetratricopeptide (TPR) repeat protein
MRVICVPIVFMAVAVLAGCGASEKLVGKSGPTPQWVSGTPADAETELRFRGMALGRNVLDEAVMHDRAMANARNQIAQRIQTRVESQSTEIMERRGSAALGEDEVTRAEFSSMLETAVQERVRLATERDRYHERWKIDPGLFSGAFTRYKYYVLVGYPREEYQRQIDRFVRLQTERAQARELLEEGRSAEAARILEALLDDYPRAAGPLRLQLAEVYRRQGRLQRAEAVLQQALAGSVTKHEEDRLREALERVEATFPEVSVEAVQVLYDVRSDLPLEDARTVVPEVLTRAGLRVRGITRGDIGNLEPDDVRSLADGAEWVVAVRIDRMPTDTDRRYYGMKLHPAAAESTVRIYALDGSLLGASVERADALRTKPRQARLLAAELSLQRALRQTLIAIAANGD